MAVHSIRRLSAVFFASEGSFSGLFCNSLDTIQGDHGGKRLRFVDLIV